MIHNDEELTVVRKQLSLVEDALASLRREVLPKNERNYEVLAEGYVDQIAALKADIEAYLAGKRAPRRATERIEGTPDGCGAARDSKLIPTSPNQIDRPR